MTQVQLQNHIKLTVKKLFATICAVAIIAAAMQDAETHLKLANNQVAWGVAVFGVALAAFLVLDTFFDKQ